MKNILRYSRFALFFLIISYFFAKTLTIYLPLFEHSDHYIFTSYALSYDNGFNSRFFIGSLFDFFFDVVSYKNVRLFVIYTIGVLIVLTSFLITKLLIKGIELKNKIIIVICISFIFLPSSITYLFNYANFARLDLFWVLITVFIILTSKFKFMNYLIMPLVSIAILIHQGFVFTYFPIILTIQIYNFFKYKSDKFYKWNLILTILTSGCLFLYLQLFTSNITDFSKFISNVQSKASFGINTNMLEYEYIYSLQDHFWKFWRPTIKALLIRTIEVIPIIIPNVLFFPYLWFKLSKNSKELKLFYLFLFISPFFALPLFILTVDWGRWYAALLNVQFLIVLFLIYNNEESILAFFDSLSKKINFLIFLIPLYFLSFDKFLSIGVIDKWNPIQNLKEVIYHFFNVLF